jgi:ferric-dicitrate binding protein FerR (iron transport regulator)
MIMDGPRPSPRPGSAVVLALACAALLALGAPAGSQSIAMGTARNAVGSLVVIRPDGIEDRLRGRGALKLFEEDVLQTGPQSQALIQIGDGISIALNENTVAKLLTRWEKGKPPTSILRLRAGEVWVKTGEGPKPFEVETPVATAVVRSTEFNMKVDGDGQTVLTVIQGVVEFGTAFGTCPIKTGTVSYGVRGKRCTKPEPTDTAPALSWSRGVREAQ